MTSQLPFLLIPHPLIVAFGQVYLPLAYLHASILAAHDLSITATGELHPPDPYKNKDITRNALDPRMEGFSCFAVAPK